MEALITLLPGDGIGPEVTSAAHRVLKEVAERYGHTFEYKVELIGGAAIDASGDPLPAQTIASCESSDAIFLGAVGGPKWSNPNAAVRPEQGLLKIRSVLGLYANLRPVKVIVDLIPASPLKAELLTGVDMIVVRELTGGIYFGEKTRSETSASDLCTYHTHEVAAAYPQTITEHRAPTADDARLYREMREQAMKDLDDRVTLTGNVLGEVTRYRDHASDDSFVLFELNGTRHRIQLDMRAIAMKSSGMHAGAAARIVAGEIAATIVAELLGSGFASEIIQ